MKMNKNKNGRARKLSSCIRIFLFLFFSSKSTKWNLSQIEDIQLCTVVCTSVLMLFFFFISEQYFFVFSLFLFFLFYIFGVRRRDYDVATIRILCYRQMVFFLVGSEKTFLFHISCFNSISE